MWLYVSLRNQKWKKNTQVWHFIMKRAENKINFVFFSGFILDGIM